MKRESWTSRLGVILAVAGSAVGLGNFLRFPAKAVQNGGGAFLIPYFVCLLLLGIPMAWIEWAMGRYGGQWSHGSAPGVFHVMAKRPWAKYLGSIGIFGPLVIFFYYIFIESWTLAYAFFSLLGTYSASASSPQSLKDFLLAYQGIQPNAVFPNIGWAYLFFLVTFLLNFYIIYRGVVQGIERVNKVALPVLAVLGIVLALRVLFLGHPVNPDWTVLKGFGFLWNPDFRSLLDAKVWLEAAGQVFFTLSIGIGVILTYASYLDRKKDIALSSLTSAATNEFFEVIVGASLVIPAAFVFFGPQGAAEAARSGPFNLSFVTMPLIFGTLPAGWLWGFFWFLLLFLAGVTSSISILQPAVSFLEDELRLDRKGAVLVLAAVCFLFSQFAVLFLAKGAVDELDFWGGSFLLVLCALIEVVIFAWIFGIDNAWKEIHVAADIRLPAFFKPVIKYVTPALLLAILGVWTVQQIVPTILMKSYSPDQRPFVLAVRLALLALFVTINILIHLRWRKVKP